MLRRPRTKAGVGARRAKESRRKLTYACDWRPECTGSGADAPDSAGVAERKSMCRRNVYVLIPGAGGDAWYWHLVIPQLEELGHDVLAISLPAGDDSAGLNEYADTIVDAIDGRSGVILVAQSLAGFNAPLVSRRVPVELLVLVNAMIPRPGE